VANLPCARDEIVPALGAADVSAPDWTELWRFADISSTYRTGPVPAIRQRHLPTADRWPRKRQIPDL